MSDVRNFISIIWEQLKLPSSINSSKLLYLKLLHYCVFQCSELDDSIDKTFVLSAVSPTQAQLINEQAEDK